MAGSGTYDDPYTNWTADAQDTYDNLSDGGEYYIVFRSALEIEYVPSSGLSRIYNFKVDSVSGNGFTGTLSGGTLTGYMSGKRTVITVTRRLNSASMGSKTITFISKDPQGTCGDSASWHYDIEYQALSILGTGATYDYSVASKPWAAYSSDITEVSVVGVSSLGPSIFTGLTAVRYITMTDSVTSIGTDACKDLTTLLSVTFSEQLQFVGDSAFSGCTSLRSTITLPDTIVTVFSSAFSGCTSVTKIILHGTPTVGTDAFSLGTSGSPVTAAVHAVSQAAFDAVNAERGSYTTFTYAALPVFNRIYARNPTWTRTGRAFTKVNGSWVPVIKFYVKTDNTWK